jgi:hypothetical protein
MANDTSRNIPGVETEPAAPNQTPYSGFPGYEEFRIGDPIPGMPGSYVGGEIVNDNGDRWNWIKGEWDYAGSGSEETKAVTPPRLDQPQTIFGPVTASGYAQPPVDPLSYYSTPEPTPEPTPYTGGPTRWTEVYRPTVDLSNVQTFTPAPTPVSTPAPQPTPSPVPNQTSERLYLAGREYLPWGALIPGESGLRVGDEFVDDAGNRWDWETDDWDYAGSGSEEPKTVTPPRLDQPQSIPKAEDVDTNIFSGVVTNPVKGDEKPYYIEDTGIPRTIEGKPLTAGLIPLDKPLITFQPSTTLPTSTAISPVTATNRQSIIRPFNMPTEVPIPPRRTVERLAPGYFQDVNYDPDEILAAAMRGIGGRQARRSILNELR